jgi:hypothetical protein
MSRTVYKNADLERRLLEEIEEMRGAVIKLAADHTEVQLNRKPQAQIWSACECFQHLNLTIEAYLPAINHGLSAYSGPPSIEYQSGFAGDRMIRAMAPSKGEIPEKKKVKTFKRINPIFQSDFLISPIKLFLEYLAEFEALVSKINSLNLDKVKVKSLVGNIIKFKLGDALQIIHVHNQRHLIQAQNTLSNL